MLNYAVCRQGGEADEAGNGYTRGDLGKCFSLTLPLSKFSSNFLIFSQFTHHDTASKLSNGEK